jgi:hypothetical protein
MRSRLRIGLGLAAAAASVAAAVVVAQPAYASNPDTIVNTNSKMCLQPVPDPFQNIVENGVRIAQMPCNGALSEQKWQSVQVGTNGGRPEYYLINQRSGRCLDVTDAKTDDRAPIQQYDCNGGGSEKWIAQANSFGSFQILNSRTGKCLDIPFATTGATYIWQYHCTSLNVAQMFTLPF